MLKLDLVPVPFCRGIYPVKGLSYKSLPLRMLLLHPDAANAFSKMKDWVIVSDMFRSPESSLQAVREGRGAQPPGYSAHNYGLAIDIDIQGVLALTGLKTKQALDERMESLGWYCHRRDHVLDSEAWHYNFLGVGAVVSGAFSSDEIEKKIVSLYGAALSPNDRECQQLLAKLRMYSGQIDGVVGPLSREAVRVFERAWGLNADGVLDAKTRRTLAYVASRE